MLQTLRVNGIGTSMVPILVKALHLLLSLDILQVGLQDVQVAVSCCQLALQPLPALLQLEPHLNKSHSWLARLQRGCAVSAINLDKLGTVLADLILGSQRDG